MMERHFVPTTPGGLVSFVRRYMIEAQSDPANCFLAVGVGLGVVIVYCEDGINRSGYAASHFSWP